MLCLLKTYGTTPMKIGLFSATGFETQVFGVQNINFGRNIDYYVQRITREIIA